MAPSWRSRSGPAPGSPSALNPRPRLELRQTAIVEILIMTDVTVYGFQISTFVNIVRLVLTHKEVAFDFHDLEPEMGGPRHLSLHPFNRVPILDHAGFRIYETSAIALYVDEALPAPHCSRRTC